MFVAEIIASLVALPFFVFGVTAFVIAVSLAMLAVVYVLYGYVRCEACGKRVRVPSGGRGSGA